jgi:hypothetical protein
MSAATGLANGHGNLAALVAYIAPIEAFAPRTRESDAYLSSGNERFFFPRPGLILRVPSGAWHDGEVAGARDKSLACLCQSIDRNEGINAKGNYGDGNDNRQPDTPDIETTALA